MGANYLSQRQKQILLAVLRLGPSEFARGNIPKDMTFLTKILEEVTPPIPPEMRGDPQATLEREKELRRNKQALRRLVKRGLLAVSLLWDKKTVGIEAQARGTWLGVRLTDEGRRLAQEILEREPWLARPMDEDQTEAYLKKVLQRLSAEGQKYVLKSRTDILEALWSASNHSFPSREAFEKYWNKMRLGLTLKALPDIKQVRYGRKGVRRYLLPV